MDWSNETWVKLYRRDTADWLLLSWRARGLFYSLLRVVNRCGVIDLGRSGKRAVAVLLGAGGDWKEIVEALDELIADGCVRVDGSALTIPHFVEAQEAVQSDRARAKAHRERVKAEEDSVTKRDSGVTKRDDDITESDESVTRRHAASRGVTRRHEENRKEEKRTEETSQSTPNGVLPAQRGLRATPDAKSKPSKADAPPPPPGTTAAAVVEAIGRSVLAGLVRYPHRFAAAQVAAYPSIDLPLQIAQASAWCVANPQHAPRADGARFLGAWLKRAHDRATSAAASQAQRVDGRHPAPSLFDGPRPVPARRVVVGESERELREYLNTHGASRD